MKRRDRLQRWMRPSFLNPAFGKRRDAVGAEGAKVSSSATSASLRLCVFKMTPAAPSQRTTTTRHRSGCHPTYPSVNAGGRGPAEPRAMKRLPALFPRHHFGRARRARLGFARNRGRSAFFPSGGKRTRRQSLAALHPRARARFAKRDAGDHVRNGARFYVERGASHAKKSGYQPAFPSQPAPARVRCMQTRGGRNRRPRCVCRATHASGFDRGARIW